MEEVPSAMDHGSNNLHEDLTNRKITRVDGKGLWRSWKRNFNSQFTAILDLIDNSLDASIQNNDTAFLGRCLIAPDTITSSNGSSWETEKTTGITIINNCISKPRPLFQCLEIYDSSKVDSGKDSVGENGVGLKQACATLSDVSFVLVKTRPSDYEVNDYGSSNVGGDGVIICELGIVAEMLQTVQGAYLPAFEFSLDPKDNDIISTLEHQMETLFSDPQHSTIAQCISQYGSSTLLSGIQRLSQHFDHLYTDFISSPHVFAVIVDQIRNDNVEERSGFAGDALTKIHVDHLMGELKQKIPLTYLHVPNSFEFCVMGERISFNYWQKRLVELSRFNIDVGTTIRFDDPRDDPQKCLIRVFVGFDAIVLKNNSEKKCGSLYLYSRQSGRLITHHVDARTLLGLSAGGTEFCSGLRILLDDYDGHLPLNPTKQDIAFSEKACGHILKENLFAWVGAVTSLYYKFHIGKFGGRKKDLSKKIVEYGDKMESADELQTELCKLDLTTFDSYRKKVYKNAMGGLTLRINGDERIGGDTLYRILPDAPVLPAIGTPADNSPIENVSKKRKLNDANTPTFKCRNCWLDTSITETSCTHCNAPRPGSLVEGMTQAAHRPVMAPAPSTTRTWHCSYCRRFNELHHEYCLTCRQSCPASLGTSPETTALGSTSTHSNTNWSCGTCKRFNSIVHQSCVYCGSSYYRSDAQYNQAKPSAESHQLHGSESTQHPWNSTIVTHQQQPSNSLNNVSHSFTNETQQLAPSLASSPSTRTHPQPSHTLNNVARSSSSESRRQEPSSVNRPRVAAKNPNTLTEGKNKSETHGTEHYKNLCNMLTVKLEKMIVKSEQRKKENHELVQQNASLTEEVKNLTSKVASLERLLGNNLD